MSEFAHRPFMSIRSGRRLCDEGAPRHCNYWLRMELEGNVPDHWDFLHEPSRRYCNSELIREPFESAVVRYMAEGPIEDEGPVSKHDHGRAARRCRSKQRAM